MCGGVQRGLEQAQGLRRTKTSEGKKKLRREGQTTAAAKTRSKRACSKPRSRCYRPRDRHKRARESETDSETDTVGSNFG